MEQGPDHQFPSTLEEITPGWLTLVLRQVGALRASSIESIEILAPVIGNGMVSQISRLGITYDCEEPGQPLTLVAKRLPLNEHIRELLRDGTTFQKEVDFFNMIAGQLRMRTPRCYFAGYSHTPFNMLILMEDLSEYLNVSMAAGCTLPQVRLALHEMALLHAGWWMDSRLQSMGIIDWPKASGQLLAGVEDFITHWPVALEVHGLAENAGFRSACKAIEKKIAVAFEQIISPPLTLCHYDFQPENFFFGSQPGHAPFVLADWSTLFAMNPGYDLAVLLNASLDLPTWRANEQPLLREYCAMLAENGVRGFTFEQCLAGYHAGLILLLPRYFFATYHLLPLTEDKAKVLHALITRNLSILIDRDPSLIPSPA